MKRKPSLNMKMGKIVMIALLMMGIVLTVNAQQKSGDIKEAPAKMENAEKTDVQAPEIKAQESKKVEDKDSATAKKTPEKKQGVKKYRGELQRNDAHQLQTDNYRDDLEKKRREIDRMGIEKIQRQTQKKKDIGETEKNLEKDSNTDEKKTKQVQKEVETKKR